MIDSLSNWNRIWRTGNLVFSWNWPTWPRWWGHRIFIVHLPCRCSRDPIFWSFLSYWIFIWTARHWWWSYRTRTWTYHDIILFSANFSTILMHALSLSATPVELCWGMYPSSAIFLLFPITIYIYYILYTPYH